MSVAEQDGPPVRMQPTGVGQHHQWILNECSAAVRLREPIKVSRHRLAGTDLTSRFAGENLSPLSLAHVVELSLKRSDVTSERVCLRNGALALRFAGILDRDTNIWNLNATMAG